ncbi:MAG: protein-glutamate O-methyltransferase CheR, partial [Thiohalomonadales bacterium]
MKTVEPVSFDNFEITEDEFSLFRKLIYEKAGISMAETKQGLVQGRLTKRLRYFKLRNFREYYDFVHTDTTGTEMQMLVDLLTTNETYFYREQKHFDFIVESIINRFKPPDELNIWSAACSSGEEPYSIAMLLSDKL